MHDQAGTVVRSRVELDVFGFAAGGEAHDHGFEDGAVSDQVGVVGDRETVGVGKTAQVHQVGSLAAQDVVVSQQGTVVVVGLEDFDATQGVGDDRRITIEVNERFAMFLGLAFLRGRGHGLVEVINFCPGDHVGDHGLGRGTTVHDAVEQATMELEQGHGHGDTDVGKDAVRIGAEGFVADLEGGQELGMHGLGDDLVQIQQGLLLIGQGTAGGEVARLRHAAVAAVVEKQLPQGGDGHGLGAFVLQFALFAQSLEALGAHGRVGEGHRAVESFASGGHIAKGFGRGQVVGDRVAAVAEVVHVDEVVDVFPNARNEFAFGGGNGAIAGIGVAHGFTGSQESLVGSDVVRRRNSIAKHGFDTPI